MQSREDLFNRIAIAVLLVLIGVGLWQGYGAWLLRRVFDHGA
jgi:hypothetical protein